MKRLGILLAALGLFLVLFAGYSYVAPNIEAEGRQQALVERYEAQTKQPGTCTAPKDVDGLLRIPSLNLVQPIVDGTSQSVLDSGAVGSYPGQPGKGNFVLTGHRVTHGEVFRNIPDLGNGDKIIVEWGCETYTYNVFENFEVPMSNTSVLNQTKYPMLTLITCASFLPTNERTVIVASLS